jgi:hypothetical protein
MSTTRRIIPVTLDVESSSRRVIVGTALALPDSTQAMNLYYGTQCLFRATMYSGAVATPDSPPADATWLFGIDDKFDADKADLVISLQTQFNIADDWLGTEGLNIIAGRICFRADLATVDLKAALALLASTVPAKIMYAYLWMFPAGGGDVLKATWPVTMFRVAVDPVTAKAVEGVTHPTIEQANSSYVPQWGDQARWRWKNGGWQYRFEEDSKWRSMLPKITDGQPGMAWGDPED